MLTQTQKLLLFSQFLVSNTSAKCPFGFGASDDDKPADHALPQLDDLVISSDDKREVRKLEAVPQFQYPSQLFQCSESDGRPKALRTSDNFTIQEYEDVAESVNQLYEQAEDKTAFAGCLVRLAGHDMMDFRYNFGNKKDGTPNKSAINQSGGVDGCINFNDKDNKGLVQCIQTSNILKAYDEHCGVVSLADFIVIAAEATMARTSKSYQYNGDMFDPYSQGTLAKSFRDQFQYGRVTEESCESNEGLMPDPENGFDDISTVFFDHMFKFQQGKEKKRLTSAILGAHTIGSAKAENSGYKGAWSKSEGVFDNDYYKQMLTRGWGPDLAVNGDEGRNQWKTVDNGEEGGLMLNSDLALAYDNNSIHQKCMADNNNNNRKCKKLQNKGKPINALTSQCCAWTHKGALFNKGVLDKEAGKDQLCGSEIPVKGKESKFGAVRNACCSKEHSSSTGDCDSAQWPKGKMFSNVLAFAADENQWLESFTQAWKIATENGHIDLQQLVNERDEEEDYECGKLRSRKLCETESDKCAWFKKTTPDQRGKFRNHCGLLTNAPVKKNRKDMTEEELAQFKVEQAQRRQDRLANMTEEERAEFEAKQEEKRLKMEEKKQQRKAEQEAKKLERKQKMEDQKAIKKAEQEAKKLENQQKKEQQKAEKEAKKLERQQMIADMSEEELKQFKADEREERLANMTEEERAEFEAKKEEKRLKMEEKKQQRKAEQEAKKLERQQMIANMSKEELKQFKAEEREKRLANMTEEQRAKFLAKQEENRLKMEEKKRQQKAEREAKKLEMQQMLAGMSKEELKQFKADRKAEQQRKREEKIANMTAEELAEFKAKQEEKRLQRELKKIKNTKGAGGQ